jgi:DNA helicase HerA-like ATPase
MIERPPSQRFGIVISGSLNKGIEVKLDSSISMEDIVVGHYVTIEGNRQRYLGMITDISLSTIDQRIVQAPPDGSNELISEVISSAYAYGVLHVTPHLIIGHETANPLEGPEPVKTIPGHFSPVYLASEHDMETVFGKEDEHRFSIGNPLDMETKLCLDLKEFAKRSNGIFGKSGTGKTFLTRILLIGMLQKSQAVNLVFDMHNEYGWFGTQEGGPPVKALKQLFPSKVAVYTLDEVNSRHRGVSTDFIVKIGYEEIEPSDISLLRQTLNLTDLSVEATYQLSRKFGRNWISSTLNLKDTGELPDGVSVHESTLQNLQRGLQTIMRLPFIEPRASANTVQNIISHLDKGINVVLEFGRYRDTTAYILVANMLARRIYASYQERTERAMVENTVQPNPLVITIEEAHKFLNPEVSKQTIFGTIAREMRKYNVTLLVIDQRPSGIDTEVMSQIGTKITCLLDNDRDIDSVLTGVPNRSGLRAVLIKLAPKQQALIFGHAVPIPVAFRALNYGTTGSYKYFGSGGTKKIRDKDIEELWK